MAERERDPPRNGLAGWRAGTTIAVIGSLYAARFGERRSKRPRRRGQRELPHGPFSSAGRSAVDQQHPVGAPPPGQAAGDEVPRPEDRAP